MADNLLEVSEVADLITQTEAAAEKGCTLQTLNNWVRRGHVKGFERYGKILVSRSEVLAFEPSRGGRPAKPGAKKARQKK